jgi:hypothetical protein
LSLTDENHVSHFPSMELTRPYTKPETLYSHTIIRNNRDIKCKEQKKSISFNIVVINFSFLYFKIIIIIIYYIIV